MKCLVRCFWLACVVATLVLAYRAWGGAAVAVMLLFAFSLLAMAMALGMARVSGRADEWSGLK